MLNVHGMVVIPSEPLLKINEVQKGAYFNFNVVSLDYKKKPHRYQASLFVPENEVDDWKAKIEPGNVFIIDHARWSMRDNPDFKFPIPNLELDRFNTKRLKTPMWAEEKGE